MPVPAQFPPDVGHNFQDVKFYGRKHPWNTPFVALSLHPETGCVSMAEYKHSVCPVWIGYLLASPVRNLYHHPKGIIGPYVKRGMTVLDFGCAMGFFSLAMARAVGPSGRVIAVDVQEKMVESLTKRAKRAGLAEIIEPYVCPPDTVGLKGRDGTIDFILAFAVVHEVPDPRRLFGEFFRLLKLEGKLLLAEPKGHVSEEAFERTLAIAGESGLSPLKNLKIFRSYAVLLQKNPESSTEGKES